MAQMKYLTGFSFAPIRSWVWVGILVSNQSGSWYPNNVKRVPRYDLENTLSVDEEIGMTDCPPAVGVS